MCAAEGGRGERKCEDAVIEVVDENMRGGGGSGGCEGDKNRAAEVRSPATGDEGDSRPPPPRRGFLMRDARTGDDAKTFAGEGNAVILFHWNRGAAASSPSAKNTGRGAPGCNVLMPSKF